VTRVIVKLAAPTVDETFAALGTDVRLIVTGRGAGAAVARARAEILAYHARLSRFEPASELCALNRDPRTTVTASALLRGAVRAGLWAARESGGLVDPCLLDALETAGYVRSHERSAGVSVPSARPAPATPHPAARWTDVHVDDAAGTITRPPGLRLDLGGSGKGHAADLVARRLAGFAAWAVDCGGDLRLGGRREVEIAHPLRDGAAARLALDAGAVATSSVVARVWITAGGRRAHHLLDPSTGRSAWTGLLTATALAPTTLHAETLAKVALLRGPRGAREVLRHHGGLIVHADGRVEAIGSLSELAA